MVSTAIYTFWVELQSLESLLFSEGSGGIINPVTNLGLFLIF